MYVVRIRNAAGSIPYTEYNCGRNVYKCTLTLSVTSEHTMTEVYSNSNLVIGAPLLLRTEAYFSMTNLQSDLIDFLENNA